MGRLKRVIYPLPRQWCRSVARFQIQEAPNGLSCAVSDARVRMLGSMDPVDYDQFYFLHFLIFNFMLIFNSMPGLFSRNFLL